jgi:hypothetical protein
MTDMFVIIEEVKLAGMLAAMMVKSQLCKSDEEGLSCRRG